METELKFSLKISMGGCSKVCRACLNDNSSEVLSLQSLVEYTTNEKQSQISLNEILHWIIISDQIENHTSSKFMCSECTENMLKCFSFRLMCLKNMATLPKNEMAIEKLENECIQTEDFILSEELYGNDLLGEDVEVETTIINRVDYGINMTHDDKSPKSKKETQDCQGPTVCEECGKKFKDLKTLGKHMVRHTNIKAFKCEECSKDFFNKGELTKHMITHNVIRKYFVCDQCGAKFSRSHTLQMHVKNHLGLRPHMCNQCPKRFLNSANLIRHIRTHNNERNYSCAHCGNAFVQRSDLIHHIKRVHPNANNIKNMVEDLFR